MKKRSILFKVVCSLILMLSVSNFTYKGVEFGLQTVYAISSSITTVVGTGEYQTDNYYQVNHYNGDVIQALTAQFLSIR